MIDTAAFYDLLHIPLGVIPAGYRALVQSAHFYLFLRDTRAVPRPIASGAIFLRDTARQTCS